MEVHIESQALGVIWAHMLASLVSGYENSASWLLARCYEQNVVVVFAEAQPKNIKSI